MGSELEKLNAKRRAAGMLVARSLPRLRTGLFDESVRGLSAGMPEAVAVGFPEHPVAEAEADGAVLDDLVYRYAPGRAREPGAGPLGEREKLHAALRAIGVFPPPPRIGLRHEREADARGEAPALPDRMPARAVSYGRPELPENLIGDDDLDRASVVDLLNRRPAGQGGADGLEFARDLAGRGGGAHSPEFRLLAADSSGRSMSRSNTPPPRHAGSFDAGARGAQGGAATVLGVPRPKQAAQTPGQPATSEVSRPAPVSRPEPQPSAGVPTPVPLDPKGPKLNERLEDRAPREALAYADQMADKYGIPRVLFRALIAQESNWVYDARSSQDARGYTQLREIAAKDIGIADRDDWRQNIEGGARYLAKQKRLYGRWDHALAAYNAGQTKARRLGPDLAKYPSETQKYVRNITIRSGGGLPAD